LIERKEEYPEERDRLLIKQLEVKIINTFNMFRIPFVIGSFGFCLLVFFRSKQPLYVRMLPLIFLGSFSSIYNYHIGQYGVYRSIDEIYSFLTLKPDSEVGRDAKHFLTALQAELDADAAHRRELRRLRFEQEAGTND